MKSRALSGFSPDAYTRITTNAGRICLLGMRQYVVPMFAALTSLASTIALCVRERPVCRYITMGCAQVACPAFAEGRHDTLAASEWRLPFSPTIAVRLSALLSSPSTTFAEEIAPVRIKAAASRSTLS